jgi:ABC-2 type transport system ATP-binding protein
VLLAVCATLVRPRTGTLLVDGHRANRRLGPIRRRIGYVPVEPGYYPGMAVRHDLEFFASAYGLRREARVIAEDALVRWSLERFATTPVGHLSRGLVRRLALARAWLHQPLVLLLDDVVSGLDDEGIALLRREVRHHVHGGGAALLTSGRLDDLVCVCSRLASLDAGTLTLDDRAHSSAGEQWDAEARTTMAAAMACRC